MNEQKESFWSEIIKFTLIAVLIVLPVRLFIAQPFIVSGASMDPTFETNQYLIIDQISYQFESPKRGEVIIFKYPKDPSKYFIKRIIGLPNETIKLEGMEVIIINKDHPEGFILDQSYLHNRKEEYATYTLKNNEYFVLGDNRLASSDSRVWGPVPANHIIGRPVIRLFPFSQIKIFPGFYKENDS